MPHSPMAINRGLVGVVTKILYLPVRSPALSGRRQGGNLSTLPLLRKEEMI